ncbi:MAG: type VI secretion system-associated FHA domain protein TagH [Gammaproteobacteria bacterium]|nr:type VI secretion system-associated FHA domain protein TagH [Gammaproteobacteria bacterium]
MDITLSVVSYHRLSPNQINSKCFDRDGGTLGRSPQADWSLPDPERVVSAIHAKVLWTEGQYAVEDLSTNGLFINRSAQPLGRGNRQPLVEGDLLRLGDYELAVALSRPSAADTPRDQPQSEQSDSDNGLLPLNSRIEPSLSDVDSWLQPSPAKPVAAASMAPASPLEEHFAPPAVQIPDDWQWRFDCNSEPVPQPSLPEVAVVAPVVAPEAQFGSGDRDPLAAFFDGLGLAPEQLPPAGDHRWWFAVGCAMQQLCAGLLGQLRARANQRSGMRVQQTTFQMRENNPLKFSASVDEVFHNLFSRRGGSFMSAEHAIRDAFADLRDHEQALMAGVKAAMLGLLAQLEPARLAEQAGSGGWWGRRRRERQRWDYYRQMHQDLVEEISNNPNGGCSDEFVKAYEARLKRRQGGNP